MLNTRVKQQSSAYEAVPKLQICSTPNAKLLSRSTAPGGVGVGAVVWILLQLSPIGGELPFATATHSTCIPHNGEVGG